MVRVTVFAPQRAGFANFDLEENLLPVLDALYPGCSQEGNTRFHSGMVALSRLDLSTRYET